MRVTFLTFRMTQCSKKWITEIETEVFSYVGGQHEAMLAAGTPVSVADVEGGMAVIREPIFGKIDFRTCKEVILKTNDKVLSKYGDSWLPSTVISRTGDMYLISWDSDLSQSELHYNDIRLPSIPQPEPHSYLASREIEIMKSPETNRSLCTVIKSIKKGSLVSVTTIRNDTWARTIHPISGWVFIGGLNNETPALCKMATKQPNRLDELLQDEPEMEICMEVESESDKKHSQSESNMTPKLGIWETTDMVDDVTPLYGAFDQETETTSASNDTVGVVPVVRRKSRSRSASKKDTQQEYKNDRAWRGPSPSPDNRSYPHHVIVDTSVNKKSSPRHSPRRTDQLHDDHAHILRIREANKLRQRLLQEYEEQQELTFKPTVTNYQNSTFSTNVPAFKRLYKVPKYEKPEDEPDKECTFRPNINTIDNRLLPDSDPVAFHDRLYEKKKRAEKPLDKECTFKPKIGVGPSQSRGKRSKMWDRLASENFHPEPVYPFKPNIGKDSKKLKFKGNVVDRLTTWNRYQRSLLYEQIPQTETTTPTNKSKVQNVDQWCNSPGDEWSGSDAEFYDPDSDSCEDKIISTAVDLKDFSPERLHDPHHHLNSLSLYALCTGAVMF